MHGAIVADILRVPWHRFILSTPHTEGERISDFKWNDWMQSLDIFNTEVTFIPFYRKNKINKITSKLTSDYLNIEFFSANRTYQNIIRNLKERKKFYLSSEKLILDIDKKILKKIDDLLDEQGLLL